MNIAMVFDTFYWGGIERVGISYIKLLQQSGHHVDAYVLNPNTESIIDELNNLCSVQIIDFRSNKCPNGWWNIILYHEIHGIETACFAVKYLFLSIIRSITKRKYMIKEKNYDIAIAFSGHINDLTFVANNYIKTRTKAAWLHGTQYSYNVRSPGFFKLYKKIHNLVSLSDLGDYECEEFNRKYNIRKRKIYNPCILNEGEKDNERISYLKEKYGDYCLMVARLATDKDQKTAIKAIQYLSEKYGIKKHLVLVGDGDKRKELEKMVHEIHMDNWIHFEGARKDVQNYYLSAQMLIHSAPLEGLPTVFLEAMHFGLPIATTDAIPGAREVLGNNEYGLISPIGSSEQLAINILRFHENQELRNDYSMRGHERIKDFSPQKIQAELNDYIITITESFIH